MRKLLKDNKGVFGLTAVQSFFAIILGIGLLAYVIVIIMGTLSGTTILSQASATVVNETGLYINTTTDTVAQASLAGFGGATATAIWGDGNQSNCTALGAERTPTGYTRLVESANYTLSTAGVLTNASTCVFPNVTVSYSYSYNTDQQNQLDYVLENTSTGITGFFESIDPVYAILAVLVIILVLVVLVRVVQAPNRPSATPQL